MAIKGKKKPRGGTGAPRAVAPKPKVEARKAPMVKRRWFRATFAASAALLILFILLTVLGRAHRTDALKTYERKLVAAQRTFKQSTEAGEHSIASVPGEFSAGKVTPDKLREESKTWEDNFRKAGEGIRAITPPKEIVAANGQFAAAMDEYVALARMYTVVANEKDIQTATKDAATKKKLGEHITLLLSHITEMKTRADALLSAAQGQLNDLKGKWGLEVASQPNINLPGGLQP
jgi:hypothetical protein